MSNKSQPVVAFVEASVREDDLPDLSKLPREFCQYCGARYGPRYVWSDKQDGAARPGWYLVTAEVAVQSHERFCQQVTPEVRAIVGNNRGYPE